MPVIHSSTVSLPPGPARGLDQLSLGNSGPSPGQSRDRDGHGHDTATESVTGTPFYANNRWLRRPGPWPGAGAVTHWHCQRDLTVTARAGSYAVAPS